ncbi:MAG: hypothetical protein M0R51_10865 [Clostridia bacterium]|jgi:hypothetical protein|nr:hypothetical protein [Clostridia bacterium]
MANEQTLTNIGAPHINSLAARRILANQILENLYQGLIEKDGKGVTQRFSDDVSGAEIRVVRIKPLTQEARELGATLNGGNYYGSTAQSESVEYGLKVLFTLDQPIDIFRVSQDMLPVDLLAAQTKNYTDLVNLNINAATFAEKIQSVWNAEIVSATSVNISELDSGEKLVDVFIEANSKLDDGDEDNGVSMFPSEDRIAVIQAAYRSTLYSSASGVLSLGGANFGYDILRKGSLDAGSEPRKLEDGFIGIIDNVPVHVASSLVLKTADAYLGFKSGGFLKDAVIGYVSSGMATSRGVASSPEVKVIDAPDGQGVRLQPLVRFGVETFYPKSVALIQKDGAINPFEEIDKLITTGITYGVVPPASRVVPSMTLTTAANAFTVTGTSCVGILYVQADAEITSLNAFFTAYLTPSSVSGVATDGSATTETDLIADKYLTCLGVAADGTIAFKSAKVAAQS